jgi:hypothetical protein
MTPINNDLFPIALNVVVTNRAAPLATVLHEAVLLSGRIATSVMLHYQGVDYLIHPHDNCPEGCPQCADRNPNLKPKHRDLCGGKDD